MLTSGVDSAKATLEAAAWHRGQAIRLGSFKQTPAGWTALRDASAQLEAPAHPEPPAHPEAPAHSEPPEGTEGTERTESVAVVLEPTGGDELAFALWARQQLGWQVYRPNPARVRAWARSQGLRAKTDQQDALLFARFGASAQPALPPAVAPPRQ